METGSTKVIVNIIYPGGVHSNISEFCLLELPSDPRRGGLFPVNDAQLQECRRVQVSEQLIDPGHYIIAAVTRRHGQESAF
jgi:hypothetical protein